MTMERNKITIKDEEHIRIISQYFIENKKYRHNMLFIMGINIGLRVSELLSLQFINILNDDMKCRDEIYFPESQKTIIDPSKRHYLAINDAVKYAVSLFIENSTLPLMNDYLFASDSNNKKTVNAPMARQSPDAILKEADSSTGLNLGINSNSMRRTFGYWVYEKNPDNEDVLRWLSDFLGHSSSAQTIKYIGLEYKKVDLKNPRSFLPILGMPKDDAVKIQSNEQREEKSSYEHTFDQQKERPSYKDILTTYFSNGFRLESPIELSRFRKVAIESVGQEIIISDEALKSEISACGILFDGKIYVVTSETEKKIKQLAEDYFIGGAQAIFFAEFYAKNEDWLFGASVVSEDMLIGILRSLFPKLSFTQTFFGYTDASVYTTLESEILRVWGNDVLLTYEQLAERLQYIPIDRIKYALSQNGDFIWSSVETFSHINQIEIKESEHEAIREEAVKKCNTRGYVPITDLPLREIENRNYELSITAIHNGVYRICLSDKFDKKGKIVTRKGDVFDALTIMKEYCRTIDKCSVDDLLNFERELTGEVHRWIPMEAGNSIMVRIDKDTYVADKYVHFDADMIDEAIGLFVNGDYLPLKSFTTFGAFPDCGQEWNLFLLESYCRRFSRRFRFDTPSVNSRNAGTVIRRSCGLDYTGIMTDAVVKADIILKDFAIGKFLYENGYTGRSTTAKVGEIIDKAKIIRERRG